MFHNDKLFKTLYFLIADDFRAKKMLSAIKYQ